MLHLISFLLNANANSKLSKYLVFITSTGDASTVAQNPAVTAAVKWQGIPSTKYPLDIKPSLAASYTTVSPTLIIQFLAIFGAVPL